VSWTALSLTAVVSLGLLLTLFIASRRGHMLPASVAILLLLLAGWVLAKLAYDADYHDADGYVDCWPSCSALQQAVAAGLSIAPLVGLVVICATVAGYALRRRRE
jgi:hypothetical protein